MTFTILQFAAAICVSLLVGLLLGHVMRSDAAYGVGYLEGRVTGWREAKNGEPRPR